MVTKQDILEMFKDCRLEDLKENNYDEELLDFIPADCPYSCNNGISKVAIHFKNTDFVIKIPFYGADFCGADDKENGSDYLLAETFLYEAAEGAELEQFFAKTEIIGQINGYNIYAQPFCTLDFMGEKDYNFIDNNEEVSTPQEKKERNIRNSVRQSCNERDYNCFNSMWLGEILDKYGEDMFNRVCDFIQDYEISDLHCENIGHLNGVPVLFDYSGFDETEYDGSDDYYGSEDYD